MAENSTGRQPATGIGLRLLDRGTQTHDSAGSSDGWGLTYEKGFIVRVALLVIPDGTIHDVAYICWFRKCVCVRGMRPPHVFRVSTFKEKISHQRAQHCKVDMLYASAVRYAPVIDNSMAK